MRVTVDADPDPDRYLERIGVDPATVGEPDRETLARLQDAHVRTVPFENLAIVGDPHGPAEGAGVTLSVPVLYEKIVERERGGYCYELNGLFHWLLAELGYDVDRAAARIKGDGDGGSVTPANHHTNVVHLDRRYVTDVGMGVPKMRGPTPIDGPPRRDDSESGWRVVDSDRPDVPLRVEYRGDDGAWERRYVFDPEPRALSYFRASCHYLSTAPESTFTGRPVVSIGTADGYRSLSADTLTVHVDGRHRQEPVDPDEWAAVLAEEFDLSVPS